MMTFETYLYRAIKAHYKVYGEVPITNYDLMSFIETANDIQEEDENQQEQMFDPHGD